MQSWPPALWPLHAEYVPPCKCWLFSWVPFAEQNLSGELPYADNSPGLYTGLLSLFLESKHTRRSEAGLGKSKKMAAVPLTHHVWLPMAGRVGHGKPWVLWELVYLPCCPHLLLQQCLWVPPHSSLLDECSVSLVKRNLFE